MEAKEGVWAGSEWGDSTGAWESGIVRMHMKRRVLEGTPVHGLDCLIAVKGGQEVGFGGGLGINPPIQRCVVDPWPVDPPDYGPPGLIGKGRKLSVF